MKKIIYAMLFVAAAVQSEAQTLRGGFGHGYFGTAFNLSSDIQNDLRATDLLGVDLLLDRVGVLGGGGGYAIFGNRAMLGGSGMGFRVSDATMRGRADFFLGGGFVNVGYLLPLSNNIFGFPYFGVGGKGMSLRIANNTSESMTIGNRVIDPGKDLKLNTAGVSFEIGYGLKLLTFSLADAGSHGGLMIGLQAGAYFYTGLEDWRVHSSNDLLPVLSRPNSFAPYVRFTVGGGGFHVEY